MSPALHLRSLCALSLALICGWAVAQHRAPEAASGWQDRAAVTARHWMVAAANPLAASAGDDVLAHGGNAIDAAVAVQLVLNVVEPQSSGIGGGAFLLYHDAAHRSLTAYDGRETAPAAATPERFLGPDGKPLAFYRAVIGGRAVGVPGTVALLYETHRRHGRMPWRKLFEHAIRLCEHGFPVSPRLATLLATDAHVTDERTRAAFSRPDGTLLREGDVLVNAALGATLRSIALSGPGAFYHGAIAQDIVDTVRSHSANPGDITLADLAAYRVKVRKPVCGPYRAYVVCGMPLPSSGGMTVLQMLAMLEPYDIAAMGPATFWSVHFMSEAGRLAYADRDMYMADPDFYAAPTGLLDPTYLARRSRSIATDRSLGSAQAGTPEQVRAAQVVAANEALAFASTSHVSIVDAQGNAVALTTTIEDAFGSRLMTRSGFLLNNELTDFSFVPHRDGKPVANRVQGGKRPRSSMSPTIVYDRAGRLFMIAGSPGGAAIINYVVKALLAVIDWKLDPQAATALPNFGSLNGPTELEQDTSAASLAEKLRANGHDVRIAPHTSGLHLIVRTHNGWMGGADPRREGVARGQ